MRLATARRPHDASNDCLEPHSTCVDASRLKTRLPKRSPPGLVPHASIKIHPLHVYLDHPPRANPPQAPFLTASAVSRRLQRLT
eukprot:2736607-Prymnesium_polylepis.2